VELSGTAPLLWIVRRRSRHFISPVFHMSLCHFAQFIKRVCESGASCLLFRLILIRHVVPAPLVMHRRWLIQLAQGRRFTVRAHGLRSIIETLPELELGITAVAEVSVQWHKLRLPVSRRRLAVASSNLPRGQFPSGKFGFQCGSCLSP
jgi:hypothetical protein